MTFMIFFSHLKTQLLGLSGVGSWFLSSFPSEVLFFHLLFPPLSSLGFALDLLFSGLRPMDVWFGLVWFEFSLSSLGSLVSRMGSEGLSAPRMRLSGTRGHGVRSRQPGRLYMQLAT